tara:strand:+ start:264 stop:479 length:216 start_codon:yes stop_codon:yes gene_type:complete
MTIAATAAAAIATVVAVVAAAPVAPAAEAEEPAAPELEDSSCANDGIDNDITNTIVDIIFKIRIKLTPTFS